MADKTTTIRVVGKDEASKTFETISQNSAKAAGEMEGHSSRIGGAFRTLDNQLGQFGIPFTGALSEIGNKLDEAGGKGQSAFQKLSNAGGLALGAISVVGAGIAIESIHLADSFETAQSRLETAIKNSGGNFDQLTPKIQAGYDQMAKFGFNATETAGALATLTNMTHDPQRAIQLLGDTANFAAQYHKDLAFSAQAVGLAAEGQVGRLARLDPELKGITGGTVAASKAQDALTKALDAQAATQAKVNDGSIKGADRFFALAAAGQKVTDAQQKLNDVQNAGSTILQKLSERDMGAAQRQSETFTGQVKALTAELENIGIKIGTFLIPIIEQLVSWISDTITWFEKHKDAAIAVAAVIGGVLATAIAAFVVNTAASFISSVAEMATHLGILGTTAEATATEMDAAAGAEAVGGGGIGGIGAAAGAAIVPLGLLAGTAYGLYQAFTSQGVSVDISAQKFEKANQSWEKSVTEISNLGKVTGDHNALMKTFNDLLDHSPQDADQFIDAVKKAGLNTDQFTQALQRHMDQTELNKIKTEEYNAKLGLLDAQTSNNSDAVNHYKTELFWLGVQEDQLHDKMITVSADVSQAIAALDSVAQKAQSLGNVVVTGAAALYNNPAAPHAEGGVFTTAHIGVVAESGPEAIVPLSNPVRAARVMSAAGLAGGGGDVYHINVAVPVGAHAADVGRQLVDALIAFQRRNGTHWQSVT